MSNGTEWAAEEVKRLEAEEERPTRRQRWACYRLGIDRRLVEKMSKAQAAELIGTSVRIVRQHNVKNHATSIR